MRTIRNLGRQYGQKFPKKVKKLREFYDEGGRSAKTKIFKELEKDAGLFQQIMQELGVTRKNQVSVEAYYNFLWPAKAKEHKCLTCGVTTRFGDDIRKYREFCSQKCLNANPVTVQRREQTMMARYGAANANDVQEFREKAKETVRRNYGVDNASQSEVVKRRKEETNMKNRGVRHHSMTEEYRQHFRENHPMLNEESKQKMKQTNLERYGFTAAAKNKDVIAKIQKTHEERYGCNAGALAEFQPDDRVKVVVDRFGVEHRVMGYENLAVSFLSNNKKVTKIETVSRDIGGINYTNMEGKRSKYYPDIRFFAGSTKPHLVEVKSKNSLFRGDGSPEYFDNCMRKFAAATKFCKNKGGCFWLFLYVGQHTDPKLIKIKNPTCRQDLIEAGIAVKD